jgi:glutathione S-transferase
VSQQTSESNLSPRPNHVSVYGVDHSPWVQAVLLALHEKKIDHTLVTVPPLSVFLNSGVLMPVAKIDDGPWLLDSERILVELGYAKVAPDERQALRAIFGSGAQHRVDQPWKFWTRFSTIRDDHPSSARRQWNHLWRAFSTFYFFTLISVAGRLAPKTTAERLRTEFSYWHDPLSQADAFIEGAAPGTVDLQLFGIVQMCASMPGPSLDALHGDPALGPIREWTARMQNRFVDYGHLYSATYFEPAGQPVEHASAIEQTAFWTGAALMWLVFPITVPAVVYFAYRIRKKGLVSR